MTSRKRPTTAHQLKITIAGIQPPVWRRVLLPTTASLFDLHTVVQVAFGWTDSHLHMFEIANKRYGPPDDSGWGKPPITERTTLGKVASKGDRFSYIYDFGDNWEHHVEVEDVVADPEPPLPRCLGGRRSGPPEDCGGPWGYESLLEAIADPAHAERSDLLEWVGEEFDPEEFDVERVNDWFASWSR